MKKLLSYAGVLALLSVPSVAQVGGGSAAQNVNLTITAGAFQITNITAGSPALALSAGVTGTNQPAALTGGPIAFQVENNGVALTSWTVGLRLGTGALPANGATAFPALIYTPGTGTVAQTAGSGYTGGPNDSGGAVTSPTTQNANGTNVNTVVRTAAANGGPTGIQGTFTYNLGTTWGVTYNSANSPAGTYPYVVTATLTGQP